MTDETSILKWVAALEPGFQNMLEQFVAKRLNFAAIPIAGILTLLHGDLATLKTNTIYVLRLTRFDANAYSRRIIVPLCDMVELPRCPHRQKSSKWFGPRYSRCAALSCIPRVHRGFVFSRHHDQGGH